MIKLVNFDKYPDSFYDYGGSAGKKRGIIYKNNNWMIKYPNSTEGMRDIAPSFKYSTSPLSEYLGSHIYGLLGIDVHETILGKSSDKLVVGCKDFRGYNETLVDFQSMSNRYSSSSGISSLSGNSDKIDEVIKLMDENDYFVVNPKLKERFWDMFIIDAFIGNNDRNNGNWGIVKNYEKKQVRIAPVYDNGASFNTKSDDNRLKKIMMESDRFISSVYENQVCHFYKDGKLLNPLKYIESKENEDCNQAVLRNVSKIDFKTINELFDELPENDGNIEILSDTRKDFYLKALKFRYDNVLKKVYDELCAK